MERREFSKFDRLPCSETVIVEGVTYCVWRPGDLPFRDGMRFKHWIELFMAPADMDEKCEAGGRVLEYCLTVKGGADAFDRAVLEGMNYRVADALLARVFEILDAAEVSDDDADPLDSTDSADASLPSAEPTGGSSET